MHLILTRLATVTALAATSTVAAAQFELTSPAFSPGGKIPTTHVCSRHDGNDDVTPVAWRGEPAGTKSFALIMDDPDAVPVAGYVWVHWNVFNIPPDVHAIPASGEVPGAVIARNSFGDEQYGGPCPPNGRHTYVYAVYALRQPLPDPPRNLSRDEFEAEYGQYILGKAELRGDYP